MSNRGKAFLYLVLVFLLVGCVLFNVGIDNEDETSCETIQAKPTPNIDDVHRYYLVLVEGSVEYESYRDQGIKVLQDVFSTVLEPGDHISAIWMEVSNLGTDEALFHNKDVNSIPTPILAPTTEPTFILIPTPLLEEATDASRLQHEKLVDDVMKKNELIRQSHYCASIFPVIEANNQLIEDWETKTQKEILVNVTDFSDRSKDSNPDYMSVFEALDLASEIFEEVCTDSLYNDCQLIIVSNMVDWRSTLTSPLVTETIQDMQIDFSLVSVSIIWPDCTFFADEFKSQCNARKEVWTPHFNSFGATEERGNLVFMNLDNAKEKLITFVGD
jgi:hypothetical protein